jgi:hypothetical protein
MSCEFSHARFPERVCTPLVLGRPKSVQISVFRIRHAAAIADKKPVRVVAIRDQSRIDDLVVMLDSLPPAPTNSACTALATGERDELRLKYLNGDTWTVVVDYSLCGFISSPSALSVEQPPYDRANSIHALVNGLVACARLRSC